MRETMGRYVRLLNDEQRDRLVSATWWTMTGNHFVDDGGCRCLCGHAEDWYRDQCGIQRSRDLTQSGGVCHVYPRAVRRFGLDRVVRAVKLRAARLNGCLPATIAALTSPHEQPQSVR